MITVFLDGLNPTGFSIGLAMGHEKKTFNRLGFDEDSSRQQAARRAGAIDQSAGSLQDVKKAEMIIIDQPIERMEEHYSIIGEHIRPNSVVVDTSYVPLQAGRWAQQYLPKNVGLVSFIPAINNRHLLSFDRMKEAGRADLFALSTAAVSSPSTVHQDAENVAMSLCSLVGAAAIFMDVMEVQVALAKTVGLPRLLAAALLDVVVDQPGWDEARVIASIDFARSTHPVQDILGHEHLGLTEFHAKEIMLRLTDEVIESLTALKGALMADKPGALEEKYQKAFENRAMWQAQRQKNDFHGGAPDASLPDSGSMFRQLFLGKLGRKRDEK